MLKRFIRWLSRYYLEICEGCDCLYLSSNGHETDDMVMLCPACYSICQEDQCQHPVHTCGTDTDFKTVCADCGEELSSMIGANPNW